MKITFDSDALKRDLKIRLKCFFLHDWQYYQAVWTADNGITPVMAFKVCRRCAKSKLIHILA